MSKIKDEITALDEHGIPTIITDDDTLLSFLSFSLGLARKGKNPPPAHHGRTVLKPYQAQIGRYIRSCHQNGSVPDHLDAASLLSLPLAWSGKGKQPPSTTRSGEAPSLSHPRLGKGKATTQANPLDDPARFTLPPSALAKQWKFRPLTPTEMLASKALMTPRRWVVDQIIPENNLVEFTAFMKYGKTTLVYELNMNVARGTPFLGRYPTQRGRALILAVEEAALDAIQRLINKLGLQDNDLIRLWPAPVRPRMMPKIKAYVDKHRVKLVTLDTWSKYLQLPEVGVESENDNIAVGRAATPFLDLAHHNTSGAAVILVHHDRKEGGADGESGRGASSLYGLVDQYLRLRKAKGPETRRLLKITGRHDVTPRSTLLDYVPNGLPPVKIAGKWVKPRHYVTLGTPREASVTTDRERVLEELKSGSAPIETLIQRTELYRKSLDEVLKALLDENLVSRKRVGKRYIWSLVKKKAVQS